jgi:hypothetical protein
MLNPRSPLDIVRALDALAFGQEVNKVHSDQQASRETRVYLHPTEPHLLLWLSRFKASDKSRIDLSVATAEHYTPGPKVKQREYPHYIKIANAKQTLIVGFKSKKKCDMIAAFIRFNRKAGILTG